MGGADRLSTSEIVTLVIAVAGLILGIRSEWRAHRHDRVSLRIVPKISLPVGPVPDPRPRLVFEIINDGFLPATVSEVGLLYHGTTERGVITVPIMMGGEKWPLRLEPHSSVTVYTDPAELENPELRRLDCAYVATASDIVFRGSSRALKHVAAHGEVPAPRRTLSRSGMPGFITLADFDDGF